MKTTNKTITREPNVKKEGLFGFVKKFFKSSNGKKIISAKDVQPANARGNDLPKRSVLIRKQDSSVSDQTVNSPQDVNGMANLGFLNIKKSVDLKEGMENKTIVKPKAPQNNSKKQVTNVKDEIEQTNNQLVNQHEAPSRQELDSFSAEEATGIKKISAESEEYSRLDINLDDLVNLVQEKGVALTKEFETEVSSEMHKVQNVHSKSNEAKLFGAPSSAVFGEIEAGFNEVLNLRNEEKNIGTSNKNDVLKGRTRSEVKKKEEKRANEKSNSGKKLKSATKSTKNSTNNSKKLLNTKGASSGVLFNVEKVKLVLEHGVVSFSKFLSDKFGVNLLENFVKKIENEKGLQKKAKPLKVLSPVRRKISNSNNPSGMGGSPGGNGVQQIQDSGGKWLSTQEEFQVGTRSAHSPQEEIEKEARKIKLWQNILYIARMKQSELPKGLAQTLPWDYRERALQLEGQKKVIDTFMLRQIDVGLLFVKAHASKHALQEFISQKVPTLSAYAKGLFEQQWLPTEEKMPAWLKWADKEGHLSGLDKPRQNVLVANALEQGAKSLLKEHMAQLQITAIDSDSLEEILSTLAERKENGLSEGLDEKVIELLEQCMGGESLLMDHIESLPPGALRSLLLHLLRSLKDRQNNELVIEALKKKIRNKKVQQSFDQALVVGSCVLDRPTILDKALKDSTIAINDVFDDIYLRSDQLQASKVVAAQQKYVKIKQSLTLMTIAQLSGASGAQKLLSSMGAQHLNAQDLQKLKEQIILSTNATLLTKKDDLKSGTGKSGYGS